MLTNYLRSYLFFWFVCFGFFSEICQKRFSPNFNLAGISQKQTNTRNFGRAVGNCLHLYVSTKVQKRQPRFYRIYGFQNARFNRMTRIKFFARFWSLPPSGVLGNNWKIASVPLFLSSAIIISHQCCSF